MRHGAGNLQRSNNHQIFWPYLIPSGIQNHLRVVFFQVAHRVVDGVSTQRQRFNLAQNADLMGGG